MWDKLRIRSLLPAPAAFRHAVRLTVAALLASELGSLFGLSQGYWAVITTLIVMQGSLGGTLGAAVDRMLATMAGAGVGVIGAWLQTQFSLPESVVLVAVSAPLAMLALQRPSFRLAPVTAAMILMMGGGSESGAMWTALSRMLEITLGCVIGVLTSQFVLPSRARPVIVQNAASMLSLFGKLAQAHLGRSDETLIEPLNEAVRVCLTRLAVASLEDNRERALRLAAGPDSAPLLRAMRRLRSDIAILGRAMAASPATATDHTVVADALKAHFDQLAAFLQHEGEAPGLGRLDSIIGEQTDPGSLQFALITLRRDLAELHDRLCEQIGQITLSGA